MIISAMRRNLVPKESGPRFAWHTYTRKKWSRFMASVSGAYVMGRPIRRYGYYGNYGNLSLALMTRKWIWSLSPYHSTVRIKYGKAIRLWAQM